MSSQIRTVGGVVAVLCAAGVLAAPPNGKPPLGPSARLAPTMAPEGPGWSENFDSYAAGSALAGQGGWAVWCTGGVDGQVSNAFAASGPNSFRAAPTTDMVQTFSGVNSGKWVFRVKTYVPSTATGSGFVILLNNYCAAANPDWSTTTELSATTGQAGIWVNGVPNGATLPLVTNQWVEYRAEFDLTADTLKEFYNNTLFTSTPQTWTGNVGPGGMLNLAALDLYSSTMDGIYYDDANLGQPCYADCNGSGSLTIADFACFQAAFVAGQPYADCNGGGGLTIADFACFQAAFVAGCP